MNEDQLRSIVREAIQRRLAAGTGPAPVPPLVPVLEHPSHRRFALAIGAEIDGPCLIEPAVLCSHCGYCQSHGH
jgi:hypothetical protein